jgi:RNA polymerase sigma factor (sigma-70 family)
MDFDFLTAHISDIYGYAVNRTADTNEAEDLAQEILAEVIDSLKRNPGVSDRERYMWKIAHNVYADHVRRCQKSKNQTEITLLSNILPSSEPAPGDGVIEEEEIGLLKREIARLSEIRRKIVVMHYFEGKPLREIAGLLNIPVGTVKWHLNGSRGEIGKGMNMMRMTGNLGMSPIRFKNISYSGNEGSCGSPQTLLGTAIRQNILYAAYQKAQSVNDIADEMGVSPPYIRDEIEFLTDYNFINEVETGRYQTNIVILKDEDGETLLDRMHKEAVDTAENICIRLMTAYEAAEDDIINSGIYIPNDDTGTLRWTAFVQSATESLAFIRFNNGNLPPHGDGHYITMAHLDSGLNAQSRNAQESPALYYLNGPMINWHTVKYGMWRVDHNWVKREPLREYGRKEIGLTGEFREGRLPHAPENAEAYRYLLENGLILKDKDNDAFTLNVVFADNADIYKRYKSALPNLSQICEPQISVLTAAVEKMLTATHPKHIDTQLRMVAHIMSTYTVSPLILRYAAETGFLPPLSDKTEKTAGILIGEFGAAFA